ncbi:probable zinc transporter protein DDB_G0291141 isoform X3 [Phalaenopsis equestris]|uniref:probable zinc transporter protein DDB_G0291141 isoform X3 n=1 Tax=Phalaenopsis equestris TaxID=78828 RepID=UPI0009E1D960|nr:probable zinc transporter protein DDB_G0291141 isoform X3 [Phalaenopsis equestris]
MANQSDHRRLSTQLRLSVPLRPHLSFSRSQPSLNSASASAPLSPFPFSPSYSTSTPSKLRRLPSASSSSFSSVLLLLFSLRSLYSLLPFLRSSPPAFSLFPFSFLVSLLSFLVSLPFSVPQTLTLKPSLFRPLLTKSFLLTLVFLLRFHSLRYCSAAASILADLSGALAARSLFGSSRRSRLLRRIIGFIALMIALILLSYSWDRVGCFPIFSFYPPPPEGCNRVSAMVLTFLSGFLGFHERAAGNSGALRQLGRKRTRLATLAFTSVFLFFPACISIFVDGGGENGDSSVSVASMVWPLINTVIFGVVLNENFSVDEKFGFGGKNFQREFLVTFFCTLLLELVYYPKVSLPGFLICGFLLWISVRELSSSSFQYVELGNLESSSNIYALIMNPLRHIMSQRKTRKIALFLLINTGYMVVEFVAGFVSNSLGLISDACHMLFDCAALAIGLYASYISGLPANNQFNYGRGRFEVLSGYANAVFLVLVGALIVLESIERILDPQVISTSSLLAVSIGGLVVNIIGLVFFHEEHHHGHGGASSCSHSHSCFDLHSHSNSTAQSYSIWHPHSHGDSHFGHENCSSKNEHHHSSTDSNVHFQPISHEHSHVGNSEHSNSHTHHHHHNHHHNQSDNCGHHMHEDEHNHNLSHRDQGRHCNLQEHDHQYQMHHVGDQNHQGSCKHNREHKSLLIGIKEEGLKMHYHIDHNMEGIFLHVLADTMGSVGVVISTLLIKYKGWLIADPACSIFISVMIISSVVPLLRNSAEILLQRIPRSHEQNLKVTRDNLMRIEGVCGVQNLHVWSFSNIEIVGTVHLHVSSEADRVLIKKRASELFHEAGIKDITIQLECVS